MAEANSRTRLRNNSRQWLGSLSSLGEARGFAAELRSEQEDAVQLRNHKAALQRAAITPNGQEGSMHAKTLRKAFLRFNPQPITSSHLAWYVHSGRQVPMLRHWSLARTRWTF